MLTQTLALFVDAYRELNSRRLFWLVLLISGAVAGVFALIGIDERGIMVLGWSLELPIFNTRVITPATFYKMMFSNLGFQFWLTWLATILALVSTAGIFPEFVSAGSIELSLSRPIGRLRLFLTKFTTGLLFVAIQVTLFSAASFLVIGVRGDAWIWKIFLAIPLVLIFFSYLFSVCVLIGLLTRSAIASLLLTLLIWGAVVLVHGGETAILRARIWKQQEVARIQETVASRGASTSTEQGAEDLARQRSELDEQRESLSTWRTAHRLTFALKTVLPKTTETMELLERSIIDWGELEGFREAATSSRRSRGRGNDRGFGSDQVNQELERTLRSRSAWWVLGTSLGFEVAVLALGAWIFCRRDF